ncbi:MAG TPA: hypothetical protein VG097_16650, partial [Gemmata sp.]|nr:hypothetical protein [Gemmata sp.]
MRHFWLKAFFKILMSRGVRRRKPKRIKPGVVYRQLMVERLEPRLAPSITSAFTPTTGLLTITSNAADHIAIEISGGDIEVNNANPLKSPLSSALVKQLQISGGPGNNLIDLSQLAAGALPNLQSCSVAGGGGNDTLIAPNQANTWNITGQNQGNFDGKFSFQGVENLSLTGPSDSFEYASAASVITGAIGAGNNPDTLTLDAGSGTLNIDGNVFSDGGSVTITASTVNVQGNGTTISSRQIAAGLDPGTAASTGNSGGITIDATQIAFSAGTRALAQVQAGSLFTPGDVLMTATASSVVRTLSQAPPTATIALTNSTIEGNEVHLSANAAEHFGVLGFVKQATADVTVGSSAIIANNVDLTVLGDTRTIPDYSTGLMTGNPVLVFAPSTGTGATITRKSGNWLTDKFVPGQSITVSGTQNNDGTYIVDFATGSTLTLQPDDVLVSETTNAAEDVQVNGNLITPDPETIFDALFPGFRGSAVTTLSTATSAVRVTGSSSIVSAQNVNITSLSESRATPYFPGLAIPSVLDVAAVWADSTASAQASIEGTSSVVAGGAFNLNAATTNNVDAIALT